jgi:DNA-binding transcriptional ArsR family regulator
MEATTFRALGEHSRLRIVETLRQGPASVGDLGSLLDIRQPQVSKHLRVLNEAGIVVVEPVARHRIYRLEEEPFEQIVDWVNSFDRLWEARLNSLDEYLDRTYKEQQ